MGKACKCSKRCQAMVMAMAREAGEARRLLAEYIGSDSLHDPDHLFWLVKWKQRVKAFLREDSKED